MQRTVSTTKRPFRTLSQVTMEMWSNAHTKYLQGYHKLMSTDSSGRVYIPSSKTWDELEGDDWKAKLAALNTEDWLAKFKKFLLKTSTCRWDTLPDAGDIDSWLRWYAASPLHRRGSPTIVACIVLSYHVLVPLPTTFSADYQRQLSEIGITMCSAQCGETAGTAQPLLQAMRTAVDRAPRITGRYGAAAVSGSSSEVVDSSSSRTRATPTADAPASSSAGSQRRTSSSSQSTRPAESTP